MNAYNLTYYLPLRGHGGNFTPLPRRHFNPLSPDGMYTSQTLLLNQNDKVLKNLCFGTIPA